MYTLTNSDTEHAVFSLSTSSAMMMVYVSPEKCVKLAFMLS